MLWAICAYFNPQRYRRRRTNYSVFRQQLGLPLLAVELGFDGVYELTDDDAEQLVQLPTGDVMWQKERLLNLALERLPGSCDTVLAVDCDVFFPHPDWRDALGHALESHPVVQAYNHALHLNRAWSPGNALESHRIFEQRALAGLESPADALAIATRRSQVTAAIGHAWGFRRAVLGSDGFFDSCIIGGGDSAIAGAAFGVPEAVVELHAMPPGQARRYRTWAERFRQRMQGSVGCVDSPLAHLWHGTMVNRQPGARHRVLVEHDFDPAHDIRLDDNGAWRWNSPKPALHEALRRYFAERREDDD